MDLTPYLDRLRDDLATSASAGDADTQRAATVLAAALEPAVRLTLMTALSDMAAEVTEQLHGASVDVRVDGRDVRVAVDDPAADDADDAGARSGRGGARGARAAGEAASGSDTRFGIDDITGLAGASGDISRITLRLVEQIKSQAERAAADQGLSLNSFVAQAVQQALHSGGHRQRDPRGSTRRAGTREPRRDAGDTDTPGNVDSSTPTDSTPTDSTPTDAAGGDTDATETTTGTTTGTATGTPQEQGDPTRSSGTRSHLHGWVEG